MYLHFFTSLKKRPEPKEEGPVHFSLYPQAFWLKEAGAIILKLNRERNHEKSCHFHKK
jgi:hypothetical protein